MNVAVIVMVIAAVSTVEDEVANTVGSTMTVGSADQTEST